MPRLGANYGYSGSPNSPLDGTFDEGYYFKKETRYWVILKDTYYTFNGQIQNDHYVLLCFDELEDCDNHVNQLQTGLMIRILYDILDSSPLGISLAQLKSEDFSAECAGRSVKLMYKGRVYHRRTDGTTKEMWLKLKIKVSEDRNKLVSMIDKFYPLLEKEPDARDVLACFEPLISESGNSR